QEPCGGARVVRGTSTQELDRDELVECLMARLEDDAHATAPELALDPVLASDELSDLAGRVSTRRLHRRDGGGRACAIGHPDKRSSSGAEGRTALVCVKTSTQRRVDTASRASCRRSSSPSEGGRSASGRRQATGSRRGTGTRERERRRRRR